MEKIVNKDKCDVDETLITKIAIFFKEIFTDALKEKRFLIEIKDDDINELYENILVSNFGEQGAVLTGVRFITKIQAEYKKQKKSPEDIYSVNIFYHEMQEKLLCYFYDCLATNDKEKNRVLENIINGSAVFLGQEISDATWEKYKQYRIKSVVVGYDNENIQSDKKGVLLNSLLSYKAHMQNDFLIEKEFVRQKYEKMYRKNLIKMIGLELEVINEKYNPNNQDGLLLKTVSLEKTRLSFIQAVQRQINEIEKDESILMILEMYKPKSSRMSAIDKVIKINKTELCDKDKKEKDSIDFYIDSKTCNTLAKNKYLFYNSIADGLTEMKDVIKNLQIGSKINISENKIELKIKNSDVMKKRNGNLQEKNLYVINLVVYKTISKQVEEIIKLYLEHLVYEHISKYRKTEFDVNKLGTTLREILLMEMLEPNKTKHFRVKI